MKKQILSLAIAVFTMLLSIMSSTTIAAADDGSNGKFLMAIAPPDRHSIPISNRTELAAIANNLKGVYHLTADIDLSDGLWVPIADSYYQAFDGVFDGQGHVIRNLTVKGSGYSYAGLFGATSSDAIIKNVGLEDVNIDIEPIYTGGICGYNNGNVDNCYSIGKISSSRTTRSNVGRAGGISGFNGGTIRSCFNGSVVTSSTDYNAYAGGISGYNDGSIENCFNRGSVFAPQIGNIFDAYAGGISGYNGTGSSVNNCYNTGEVSASLTKGRSGFSSYYSCAGGISGYNEAESSISNCYNTGAVSVSRSNSTKDYSFVGGICGYLADNATIRSSYWNTDSYQTKDNRDLATPDKQGLGYGMGQATALTTAQMKTQASYSGWDFTNTWTFVPGENNDYPVLRAFYDLPSSWAEYSVNQAIRANLVPKALQGKYTAEITRAEFCALAVAVYETYTGAAITAQKTFTDTTDPNVQKMAGLGVVTGGGDGTFNPGGTFNREMAAVLLVNLLNAMNITLDKADVAFSDKADIAFWAFTQVGQAQAAGLVSGSDGKYNPKGKFTRESGIILMLNLWDYLKK